MYAGKYMNMYGLPAAGGVEQVPAGWDHWYGQVSLMSQVIVCKEMEEMIQFVARLETLNTTTTLCQ